MPMLSISENIFMFIAGLGLLQGFLLAALLYFHPNSHRQVNKFLALYIITLSLVMAGPLFLKIAGWRNSFFFGPLPVLVGPLLYLYVRSFRENITFKKAWPHFILFPVFFVAIYWWSEYLNNKYPGATEIPAEGIRAPFSFGLFAVRYIHLISYYFLSRRELKAYQQSIRDQFSNTSRINLDWVKWLSGGFLFIVLASMVSFFMMVKYPENFNLLYVITIAIATPYVYLATYKGITQPTIWQKAQAPVEEPSQQKEEKEISINKPLVQRHTDIITRITQVMDNEKLYQEPELTLQDLSAKLEFPPHQVSQAINEGMKKNFYDLVNGYRVEEAKRLLLESKNRNYTILSVGFEAGFNSKTTFNTVFKKFTGLTPTDFRDQQTEAAVLS